MILNTYSIWQVHILVCKYLLSLGPWVLNRVIYKLQIPNTDIGCSIEPVSSKIWLQLFLKFSPGLYYYGKGKAIPLQAWTGPEGSRKLRLPDFVTTAQDGGKVVSLRHWPLLPPGNAPGTHFCSRLSRPQGHSAIGRILCQ